MKYSFFIDFDFFHTITQNVIIQSFKILTFKINVKLRIYRFIALVVL